MLHKGWMFHEGVARVKHQPEGNYITHESHIIVMLNSHQMPEGN